MQTPSNALKLSPKKPQPALVSLKLDYRDYQPSDAKRTTRNAHTPTEKINNFTNSPHYPDTPPMTAEEKYFKAPAPSLRKITSDRHNEQPPDGFSRLLEEYFPPKSEPSIASGTSTNDDYRFVPVSKQCSPTALQQRGECMQRPSQYFANELGQGHPLKDMKMHRPKEPSFAEDILRKPAGNISPTAATINTCSTFETLRQKKSME